MGGKRIGESAHLIQLDYFNCNLLHLSNRILNTVLYFVLHRKYDILLILPIGKPLPYKSKSQLET